MGGMLFAYAAGIALPLVEGFREVALDPVGDRGHGLIVGRVEVSPAGHLLREMVRLLRGILGVARGVRLHEDVALHDGAGFLGEAGHIRDERLS